MEYNWKKVSTSQTATNMRKLTARPNHSKRTFTIRYNGNKYRTSKMQKIEFEDCLFNVEIDWKNYLRNNQVTAI